MDKKLKDILYGFDYKLQGDQNSEVKRIVFDSREAKAGDLFAALKGAAHDGHKYIEQVCQNGVQSILCSQMPDELIEGVNYIHVENTHNALAYIAANFYDNPSANFKLIGVTGTNGKTSIATLLHRLFMQLGYKSGLLSTVQNLIGERAVKSTHTTPDPVAINKLMAEMLVEGCDYVFMEVSSHAIDQKRITGLHFDGGVFTNITHDHLDYHKTFDSYIRAKKAFFDQLPKTAFALVNKDDKRSAVMVQNTLATKKTYSLQNISDFKAKVLESHFDGTLLLLHGTELWSKLIGQFNASNLLAVYAVAMLLNQDQFEVMQQLSSLENVDGRFEYLQSTNGVTAVIDYAHTPDALKNVIETINQIRSGAGQLITVVGAGGNRDKTKRPEMARIAASGSNKLVLTSDNPRDENPQDIIDEMSKGVEVHLKRNVLSITDRREAIRTACMLAVPGDIILVAGKGHETYQEIKGTRIHFSDKEILAQNLMLNQINPQ